MDNLAKLVIEFFLSEATDADLEFGMKLYTETVQKACTELAFATDFERIVTLAGVVNVTVRAMRQVQAEQARRLGQDPITVTTEDIDKAMTEILGEPGAN